MTVVRWAMAGAAGVSGVLVLGTGLFSIFSGWHQTSGSDLWSPAGMEWMFLGMVIVPAALFGAVIGGLIGYLDGNRG